MPAERIIEERPAEPVVIHERDHDHVHDTPRSNAWVVVAVIVAILLLLLIFGRGMFGGTSSGSSGVNVTPSTSSSGQ